MSEIQLHERSKDEIFNIAVQLRTDNFIKEKRIEKLEKQLQQKENIIKEVREYIENDIIVYYVLDERLNKAFDKTKKVKKDLLEILDKVEENK